MMRSLATLARVSAGIIALIAFVGLAAQLTDKIDEGQPWLTALGQMTRFFTDVGNATVVIVFAAIAWRGRERVGAQWQALAVIAILLVGIVFSLLLRGLHHPTGLLLLSSRLNHDVVPPLALLWWLIFAPRGGLDWRAPWRWLALPLTYSAYVELRGLIDGFYPYGFMNPGKIGWGGVVGALAGIGLGFLLFGFAMVALDRWLAKRRAAR